MNKAAHTKTWGIIGLGWLGSALAEQLRSNGQKTWGTHRSSFDFKENPFPSTACDVLFLNTPPIHDLLPSEYVAKIHLSPEAKIIFTSSTSVYGKNNTRVDESSATHPLTDSAKWLCEVETRLQEKFKDRLLILRLGGLIGKNRHPIRSLSGKTNVPGGNDAINLIHLTDLLCIILLLEKKDTLHLVNVLTPFHPTKDEYYNEWAARLQLTPVNFVKNADIRKEINSQYLADLYPNWLVPKLDRLD